jgi:acetyltransferase-like isoleucine patch superfamily enzyme
MRRVLRAFWVSGLACLETFLASLPNAGPFSKLRVWYWRQRGYAFAKTCFIARNVYFQGLVSIGEGSHIANNCLFNGGTAGISIGQKTMIAPNCVIVAFDHGYRDLEVPMIDQPCETAAIIIEDDVWIAANCTIAKGVRLGKGCIVSANSMVRVDVEPYAAVRGVPARVIGSRKT